jgi:hypothetical protein
LSNLVWVMVCDDLGEFIARRDSRYELRYRAWGDTRQAKYRVAARLRLRAIGLDGALLVHDERSDLSPFDAGALDTRVAELARWAEEELGAREGSWFPAMPRVVGVREQKTS